MKNTHSTLSTITNISNQAYLSKDCDDLFEQLYPAIKQLAHFELMKLNPGQQLTPTVLVSECYLKLKSNQQQYENQKHFYNTVARCMRFFLVDMVRSHQSLKRKGEHTEFSVSQIVGEKDIAIKLLELDNALQQLEEINVDLSNITMMRYFSGMTLEEIAEVYKCSTSHIHKQWQMARALLVNLLSEEPNHENQEQ